ncbi:hypothetical protein ACFY2W_18005 [Streptomyces sp. NPDC001262]|uniref:hypothetical protein n=1 Tax=unclassified Streptomyces TaxID=2593676 RepID=UPI00369F451A
MLIKARRADVSREDRRSAIAIALGGLVLAVAAGILLLVTVPGLHAEERDFKAASPCPSTAPAPDCERPVGATVTGSETDSHRKTPRYWLDLAERDGTPHHVRMNEKGYPVFASVGKGDPVTLWYWRGHIRFIDFHGLRQSTHEDPTGDFRLPTAIGMGLSALALNFFWCAYWLARRSGSSRLRAPWQLMVPTMATVCLATVGGICGYLGDGMGEALRYGAAGAVPVLAVTVVVAVWNVRQDRRRETDTIEVTPVVPDKEEICQGLIIGDVPYSVDGFGILVAGPGLLAATPDPTGHFARKVVPRTLVVERVRPPYRTDPGPDLTNFLIAECRDGGTPVLIASPEVHMPWVLGALEAAEPEPVTAESARPADGRT